MSQHLSFYYFFFFFSCSGDHRDLHSFPTRRSSDLARTVRRRQPPRAALGRNAPSDRRARAGRDETDRRDRKSTRLNSSHVEISYAVFCLKKKKKKHNMNNQFEKLDLSTLSHIYYKL